MCDDYEVPYAQEVWMGRRRGMIEGGEISGSSWQYPV